MLFAEKLIQLRKKYEMSQEELADKLDVSRQSVSKWESGTSTPDLTKMVKLSEVFEVSLDYLVNDDMEEPIYNDSDESTGRVVSMEEADAFLRANSHSAPRIALGVALCIIGPAVLIMLASLADVHAISLNEDSAGILGVVIMLSLIVVAVGLFVMSGFEMERYNYLEKDVIDLAYGVKGNVNRLKEEFEPVRRRRLVICICSYIAGVIPIIATGISSELEAYAGVVVGGYLVVIAIATCVIVYTAIISSGYNKLLQLEDYSVEKKEAERKESSFVGAYWVLVVGIYLAYSFITRDWKHSWEIWPVAVFIFVVIKLIMEGIRNKQ